MATVADDAKGMGAPYGAENRFFAVLAAIMAGIIVAGFSVNLAMGRSTFAVPAIFHVHAFIFFGWVALYLAQSFTIMRGKIALHRALGRIAYIWIPAMVAAGVVMCIVSLRRTGVPFFFDQNEFLVSNILLLLLFGALALIALRAPRTTGWHPRLMVSAMALLVSPGLGRLLPMPFMIPYAWLIPLILILAFPIAGMVADKRRTGRVHPAWLWAVGAIVMTQVVADLIAYSDWGIAMTRAVVEGTPGAQRPMAAFLPEGFL